MNIEQILDSALGYNDHNMRRDRTYDGQPHTDHGLRGQEEVKGITFRDVSDCFLRALFLSAFDQAPAGYAEANKGQDAVLTWNDAFALDMNKIDIMAVSQNLSCEIERIMGIFPNIPGFAKEQP